MKTKKIRYFRLIVIYLLIFMMIMTSISFFNHAYAIDNDDYDRIAHLKFSDYDGYSLEYLLKK